MSTVLNSKGVKIVSEFTIDELIQLIEEALKEAQFHGLVPDHEKESLTRRINFTIS